MLGWKGRIPGLGVHGTVTFLFMYYYGTLLFFTKFFGKKKHKHYIEYDPAMINHNKINMYLCEHLSMLKKKAWKEIHQMLTEAPVNT